MALPWLPCRVGVGSNAIGISRKRLLSASFRVGRLALVSYAVGMGTWWLLTPPAVAARSAAPERVTPLARGVSAAEPSQLLTVSIDGLVASVRSSGTVGEALSGLGLTVGTGDRLSTPAEAPVRAGHRIVLDRGLPVTLLDGGRPVATRSAPGTVADLLAAALLTLGPLDRVDRPLDDRLGAGDVVRITRVAEGEITLHEDLPFGVRYVQDPNLDRGRRLVGTPGQPGQVVNTYLVRFVDGKEVSRILLGSRELTAPVDEVRRLGTRTPRAPSEIEALIREAAARHGADPDQMVRVAWCESRFNPNAYNASGASGLYQFMPRTWAANSVRAGYAGASPFDPVAAANVAAWMFARGSANLWTCK